MSESTVIYQAAENVATITINRPERRNALDPSTLDGLIDAFVQARQDAAVRVVVLTGAGDRAFCAGADLGGSMSGGGGFLDRFDDQGRFLELFRTMAETGKPIVGRVNGHALAGGLGVMLACDLVVATQEATFGTPEIKVGLFPYMIMALIFRHVGRKRGLEMVLTGDRISATEAREAGLINHVVPKDELDRATAELAGKLRAKSSAILRLGLKAFHTMADLPKEQALEYLRGMLVVNTLCEDAGEGIMAFMQKREPEWKDR